MVGIRWSRWPDWSGSSVSTVPSLVSAQGDKEARTSPLSLPSLAQLSVQQRASAPKETASHPSEKVTAPVESSRGAMDGQSSTLA